MVDVSKAQADAQRLFQAGKLSQLFVVVQQIVTTHTLYINGVILYLQEPQNWERMKVLLILF